MSKQPVRRVLFVANDHVGTRMAGPGIRAVNLARQLAREFEVTLAAPNEAERARRSRAPPLDSPWQDG